MPRRKVYLVSPREPSGATWLINCLLELGVMTYRYSPAGMWRREGDHWRLNPHERVLRKWLPALSDHEHFAFREDLEVQWMHEWYTDEYAAHEVLYFVRDPRDALYSRYKREAPRLSYREFAAFPDVYTLLDKVTNWWLYTSTWLTHPRLSVCRFEDYKADAATTLARVLETLQLHYDSARIEGAVRCSTFERAAAAEAAYRAEHPEDAQVINRSGVPMSWQAGGMDSSVANRIEEVCSDLLRHFGYACALQQPCRVSLSRHIRRLRFLEQFASGARRWVDASDANEDASVTAMEFISTLNSGTLSCCGLPDHELRQLQASIREFLGGLAESADSQFGQVFAAIPRDSRQLTQLSRLRRGLSTRLRKLVGTRD